MAIIAIPLLTVIILLSSCICAFADSLSEDHWKFVCSSSRETILEILECSTPLETQDSKDRIERLLGCTGMPEIEILTSMCRMDTLPKQKKELISNCIEQTFGDIDPSEPNPVIPCIEQLPAYQKMVRGG
uniref:Uncharacterized protein n=1 Tax=Pandinus cavimanus TaxID=217261 RepID=H2CYN7_PANCV|nr:hypothetical protein [Pandinus cavimanus]